MNRHMEFIIEDDVLYPHSPAEETLVYTALLRLPNSLSKKDKIKVITQLVLTKCMSSTIRSSLVEEFCPRGRGGGCGAGRMVNIRQKMLINPSLMFLDEPTSGLDSATNQRTISVLGKLAYGGGTIVLTIHQPSSRLFHVFQKALLLSEGNSLYSGKASTAMDYFANIGFSPLIIMNPSDFF